MFCLSFKYIDKDQKSQKKGSQLNTPIHDPRPKGLVNTDIKINTVKKYKGYIFFVSRALNPCKEEPQIEAKRIKNGPIYPEVGNKKQPANNKFLPRL
tara:strand:- start:184 stop:474 length:291 start_codon:yes stop_codon:yes gene_type:complete